ncbi:MAG TPA: hypothetical protein VHY18_02495 [Solirubrobacteraceae bacterium]|jgi:hypothetical protein|nr:hypothetical protein [Solirubrobacteraceae bacterium]
MPSELVKRLRDDGFSKTTVLRALERLAREGEINFAPAEPGTVGRTNPTGHYLLSGRQRTQVLARLRQRPVSPHLAAGAAFVFAECRSGQVPDLLRATAPPSVTRRVTWVCRVDGDLTGFLFGLDKDAVSSDSDRLVKVLADVGIAATTSIVREALSPVDLAAQANQVDAVAPQSEGATEGPVDLESRRPRRAEIRAGSPHAE